MATVSTPIPPSIPESIPDSVKWKLFRAQEHLEALKAEARRFYQKNPAKVVRQPNGSPNEFVGEVQCDVTIPGKIPIIIGDFLTNLRSSLDYLVWELVLAANNIPTEKNMFPICTTPKAFDDQIRRHRLDGIPIGALTEIQALQPYHCGQDARGHVLALLDEFCNINKHRRVLTTMIRGGMAPPDFATVKVNGETFGYVSFESILKQGTKIGPFPMIDGPFGRSPKVEVPREIVAFIAFGEGAAKDVEIGFALAICGGYVVQELSRFAKFFG